jgi:hypothetical protein
MQNNGASIKLEQFDFKNIFQDKFAYPSFRVFSEIIEEEREKNGSC